MYSEIRKQNVEHIDKTHVCIKKAVTYIRSRQSFWNVFLLYVLRVYSLIAQTVIARIQIQIQVT